MEPKILKLKHPVGSGETAITELEFKGPLKGKHMKGVPAYGSLICMEHILMVGGRLCNQPPSVMNELQAEDMQAAIAITSGFLEGGPTIGQPPSE
ncbi:phage tail assembly protein [Nitratidesulfovibrio liaohensis]|uniref:Phage tail assembly protein n=1 Tax=Nitratidesulfovibrio liaohensis TaxID=2604158 RepID=A0ABY9R4V3_9BACT|nr:phage tail assembly protein [Nitratidesulfovibrio liaohensis]WMW65759.1 phage tail assembly protein [Nitratidesulfovibrio liaohensis]